MLLQSAKDKYENLKNILTPKCDTIVVSGSIRRNKPDNIKDIDMIVLSKDFNEIENWIKDNSDDEITGLGGKFMLKFYYDDVWFNIFKIHQENHIGPTLLQTTGSAEFNILTRAKVKSAGLKLNQYGLFKGEIRLDLNTEEDILKFIYGRYIKPEDRTENIRVNSNTHYVNSFTNEDKFYRVDCIDGIWTCTCPHYKYRGVECKHIKKVKLDNQ